MGLTVTGKINSPRFHKARTLVESLAGELDVTVTSLLPIDYDRFLEATKRELGGLAWAHTAQMIVTSDEEGYIGDDEALTRWVKTRKLSLAALNSDGSQSSWESMAEVAYATYLATSGNQYAFLDLAVDGQNVGRLLFEIYAQKLPKTCENFLQLCTGGSEQASGKQLHYMNSPIHRIMPDGWIQGGDVVSGTGAGGISAFGGGTIPDESFCIPHDQPGILGMASTGPHTAASQFYVTLRALPSFDYKSVAFGRLIDGRRVLEFVGSLETKLGRPTGSVTVCSCGKLTAVNLGTYDQQAAAVRLQAVQRSRAARKEAEEKAAAAAKVQAISKGRATRKQMTTKRMNK